MEIRKLEMEMGVKILKSGCWEGKLEKLDVKE